MRGRSLVWMGLLVLLGVVAVVLVLGTGDRAEPFNVDSSHPDGYRAMALMLRDAGAEVVSVAPSELDSTLGRGDSGGDGADVPPDGAVVVPVADWLDDDDLDALRGFASNGATVVLSAESGFSALDTRVLTRTPAVPVRAGRCTVGELEGLEAVDDVAYGFVELDGTAGEVSHCFTEAVSVGESAAVVVSEVVGAGRVVRLGSPYLWVNARLQPDKERGGDPLDNASVALALLGDSQQVTFVRAQTPEGITPDGTRNPIGLLPLNVKLALVQLGAAFVVYAWWRGRRLGRPVGEEVPVEVAGSELVEAVGGLLRRHGSVGKASAALRDRECREFAKRLGVPREAGQDALVSAVAARSGRRPEDVSTLLFGAVPAGPEGLVTLCDQLDRLHSEVLDVQHAP